MPPKKVAKPQRTKASLKIPDDDPVKTDTTHSVLGDMKGGSRLSTTTASQDLAQDPPTFSIPFETKSIIAKRFSPPHSKSGTTRSQSKDNPPALIFTHGAGGGIANPATASFARGFSQHAPVVLYQGTMNLQNRVKTFHAVINYCEDEAVALGGRSMGARAAIIATKEHETKALVLVSYPLVGAKGEVRDQILKEVEEGVEVLFVCGSRDGMCDVEKLNGVRGEMQARSWLCVVEGADHGMSLSRKGEEEVERTREFTGEVAARWLLDREEGKRFLKVWWDEDEGSVGDSGWMSEKGHGAKSAKSSAGKRKEKIERANHAEQLRKRRKTG